MAATILTAWRRTTRLSQNAKSHRRTTQGRPRHARGHRHSWRNNDASKGDTATLTVSDLSPSTHTTKTTEVKAAPSPAAPKPATTIIPLPVDRVEKNSGLTLDTYDLASNLAPSRGESSRTVFDKGNWRVVAQCDTAQGGRLTVGVVKECEGPRRRQLERLVKYAALLTYQRPRDLQISGRGDKCCCLTSRRGSRRRIFIGLERPLASGQRVEVLLVHLPLTGRIAMQLEIGRMVPLSGLESTTARPSCIPANLEPRPTNAATGIYRHNRHIRFTCTGHAGSHQKRTPCRTH